MRFAHALLFEKPDEHRREGRLFPGAFGEVAIGEHLVHLRLGAAPVDLQIVEHHAAAARFFQERKRVRREKPRGIEQVRVGLARGDNEAGQGFFHGFTMLGVAEGAT